MSDTSSDQLTIRAISPQVDEELHLNNGDSQTSSIVSVSAARASHDHIEEEEQEAEPEVEDEEDPLSVKQLSLNFEYAMYKIDDRVKTLSEQTEEVVLHQRDRFHVDVDKIDAEIIRVDKLMSSYKQLMNEFVKLEQLGQIVKDFNSRLATIEHKLKTIG